MRQFVYPMAGHNAKARSMLLKALEGSAGNTLQPSPGSPDSCFIWHLGVWCFFPRHVKAALWPAEGERCSGLQAGAESLPLCLPCTEGFHISSRAIPAHRGVQEQVALHPYGPGNTVGLYSCIVTRWLLLTCISTVVQTICPIH